MAHVLDFERRFAAYMAGGMSLNHALLRGQAMRSTQTTRVEFRQDWFGYRAGETADLSADLARTLIADGTARACPAIVDIPNKSMKAREVERK